MDQPHKLEFIVQLSDGIPECEWIMVRGQKGFFTLKMECGAAMKIAVCGE